MRLKADLTLLFVSMIWGTAFVAQRVAGRIGSVYYFNGVRYILAALVVLPVAFRVRLLRGLSGNISPDQLQWMCAAGMILFGGSAFQQLGMIHTAAGNAGFIASLYVVMIPVVLFLVWGERPHWLFTVAAVIAGVGAYFLSTAGRFRIQAGDSLELAGALCWAFHVIVLGKFASKFEAVSFSVGQLLVCGLLNLFLGALLEPLPPFNLPWIGAVAYTAFLSLGLCYTLQIWAQKHTPPADAAIILSLESVFAVISARWILKEFLLSIQVWGCVLIFIAVVLSQFKEWTNGIIDRDHLVEGR